MFCPECKAELPDDAKFCIRCGYDFTRIKTPPPEQGSDLLGRLRTSPRSDQPEVPPDSGETMNKGEVFARRYRILSEGKRGGMGVVYKCEDQKLNRTVALKVIHPKLLSSEQAVKRFRQEVSISLELLHKNIVRVHNLDEYEGIEFFTMEWVEGKSLREILNGRVKEKKPFTLEEAYIIISQLSDALQYAHQHTIHRDIKPENILIFESKDGLQVKLTDFGIAKMLTPAQFTSTSLQMGTPYYMAPEQKVDAAHVDKRADIYASGVVFFELLTLENTIGFELPSEINTDLPKAIDDVIRKGIATKPLNRYGEMKEFSGELAKIVEIENKRVEEEKRKEERLREKEEERLRREAEEAEKRKREEERKRKEEDKRRLEELRRKEEEEKERRRQEEERRLAQERKRAEEAKQKREEEEEAKRKKRNTALWSGLAVIGVVLLIIYFGYRRSETPQVPPEAPKKETTQVSPPAISPAPPKSAPAPASKETKPAEAMAPAPKLKEEPTPAPAQEKPKALTKETLSTPVLGSAPSPTVPGTTPRLTPEPEKQIRKEIFKYALKNYESSKETYLLWSSHIRESYKRSGEIIYRGRGGYYLKHRGEFTEIGWCSEALCNDFNRKGIEIFNLPFTVDPKTVDKVILGVHTYTPDTQQWYGKVSFDILVNDTKIGSIQSAERGREKVSEVTVLNPSIFSLGKNNLFLIYNEDREGYGLLTRLDWIQMVIISNDMAKSEPDEKEALKKRAEELVKKEPEIKTNEFIYDVSYGKVRFNHKKHAEIPTIDCMKCHHTWKIGKTSGTTCKSCHGVRPEGKKISAKDAFHKNCKGCHEETKKANKPAGPTGCTQCHIKTR